MGKRIPQNKKRKKLKVKKQLFRKKLYQKNVLEKGDVNGKNFDFS